MNEPLNDLMGIMATLRDKEKGCDWSLAQTLNSLTVHTLEEAYELVEAIERNDLESINDELGDLLFQIIFYCQITQEQGHFSFEQVIHKLQEKLIRRHPHVFDSGQPQTQAHRHALKKQERQQKSKNTSILGGVTSHLPSLSRAQKIQELAASVGFEWPDIHPVKDKLHEEVSEFEEALRSKNAAHAKEELGDILFTCVNLARHLNCDAEQLLRHANAKFEKRFNAVEQRVSDSEKSFESMTLEELEALWQKVKACQT